MRILYVEDNPDVATIVTRLLEDHGCDVYHFPSAAEALEALDSGDYKIDLVFTDIRLGAGKNGIQLAEQINPTHPNLPIVLTTGYASAIPTEGITSWLVIRKPFNVKELVDIFKNLLVNMADRRLRLPATPPVLVPEVAEIAPETPEDVIDDPPTAWWRTRLRRWWAELFP